MNEENHQDRVDPLLAIAYAELRDEGTPEPDWEALRRAIRLRAAPHFSRRKVHRLMRVSRPLLPLALAASLAFGLWIGPDIVADLLAPPPAEVAAVDINVEEILVQAIDGSISDQEFRLLVTGRANPDALLAFAVSGR